MTIIEFQSSRTLRNLWALYRGKHTGSFGRAGVFSFNGNKIVTSGAGGVLVTDDESSNSGKTHNDYRQGPAPL